MVLLPVVPVQLNTACRHNPSLVDQCIWQGKRRQPLPNELLCEICSHTPWMRLVSLAVSNNACHIYTKGRIECRKKMANFVNIVRDQDIRAVDVWRNFKYSQLTNGDYEANVELYDFNVIFAPRQDYDAALLSAFTTRLIVEEMCSYANVEGVEHHVNIDALNIPYRHHPGALDLDVAIRGVELGRMCNIVVQLAREYRLTIDDLQIGNYNPPAPIAFIGLNGAPQPQHPVH